MKKSLYKHLLAVLIFSLVSFAYFYPVLWPAVGLLISITVMHNTVAFATGAVVGLALTKQPPIRRALTFEVGIQNSGLALIILLSQLKGVGGAAAIAAVWGVWHLMAGGLLSVFYNYIDKKRVALVTE